jgi:hypothetical protein
MTGLSDKEKMLFDAAGGVEDPKAIAKLKEQDAKRLAAFIADSLSIKEASSSFSALGGRRYIERMIRHKEIIAFFHGNKWLIPKFQFRFGGLPLGYRELITFLLPYFKQNELLVCSFLNEYQLSLIKDF